jgi:integrase/recombinase XerD
MQKRRTSADFAPADRVVFDGPFRTYLRNSGLGKKSVYRVRWAVRYAACWQAQHGSLLTKFRRRDLNKFVLASASAHWPRATLKDYRTGLSRWFRFQEPLPAVSPPYPWQPTIDAFLQFLEQHRGTATTTQRAYRDILCDYLKWQFGRAKDDWPRIGPEDIWKYARVFQRGRKPSTLNQDLSRIRHFFRFLHLKGRCDGRLVHAVPRFNNYGQSSDPEILTDQQRQSLLDSLDQRTPIGSRDHCLTLCMVDLGLRPIEVANLTLDSIDWHQRVLTVPATKTDRGRQLPLLDRILMALRNYIRHHRPATPDCRLFVHHKATRRGDPMDSRAVREALLSAHRRGKLPGRWKGSYRLRHTFATRLHAREVDLKQIADLLGHRHLQTTTIYAKVNPTGLRALALPWPL